MIMYIFRKAVMLSAAVVIFLISFGPYQARAAEVDAKTEKVVKAEQEKMKKLIQDAKEKLNNTVWEIELKKQMMTTAESGKKSKNAKGAQPGMDKDTVIFKDNRVESSLLAKEGFTPTNYTVRLKGRNSEIVIWETMQTSQEKGLAFWRGEIENGIMRGVLSWQIKEGNKQDYSFVSASSSVVAAQPPAEVKK